MLSRTPSLASACLRCQTRLAGRNRVWDPSNALAPLPSRRWQSAAAALAQDGDHASQPDGNDSREPDKLSDGVEQYEKHDESSANASRSPRSIKYRRWRPTPAEDLGVNVLGRPAEVLILPTRKRKVARLVPEEEKNEEKSGIQKSLDSELKPVSMADVFQNIDSLKTAMGQGKDNFSAAEWRDHRKRLADGFTKTQLEEYMRRAGHTSKSDYNEDYKQRNNQKRNMAAKIMTEVWNWTCQDVDQSPLSPQPKPVKKTIVIKAAKLDYVMLHQKQQLGHLSESFGVQIDVFKKKSRVHLSGSATAIDKASSRLNQMLRGIQESSLQMPAYLQGLLKDEAGWNSLLARLMQKHKLVVQKSGDMLDIIGPESSSADLVLRDLVLFSGMFRTTTSFSMSDEDKQDSTVRAPFWPNNMPHWLQHDQSWYRYISTKAHAESEDAAAKSDVRELRRRASNVLKSEKPDQDKLSRFKIAPGSLRHEYVAEIGQVLFEDKPSKGLAGVSVSETQVDAHSTLVLQQALLPQLLAREDFVPFQIQEFRKGKIQPFLLRLRLDPVTELTTLPPVEILLSGQDASLGLRQQLNIKKVFAILDEWRYNLLLANKPLDIQMHRQSKIDLLGNDKAQPTRAYLDVLRQLGSYLEQAQSSSQGEFAPIWRLDISPLLNDKGNKSQANTSKSSPDSQIKTETAEAGKVSATTTDVVTKSSATATAKYILYPPEYLDIASYTSKLAGDRYIDHIVCDTGASDLPQQSQTLRITSTPLIELLQDEVKTAPADAGNTIERQRLFKNSVTTAYSIATMLGDAEKVVGRNGMPAKAA